MSRPSASRKLPPYKPLSKPRSSKWRPPTTLEERLLAEGLVEAGLKIAQNRKICGFFPDIHICGTRLLIEIDGKYHDHPEAALRDKQRAKILRSRGFKILRFTNSYIRNRLDYAIAKILRTLSELP